MKQRTILPLSCVVGVDVVWESWILQKGERAGIYTKKISEAQKVAWHAGKNGM